MPGPFPGMDPYLEYNALWSGVHQGLIGTIRNALNAVLPSGYVADMGERVFVLQPGRSICPDLAVFEQTPPEGVTTVSGAGGAALADSPVVLLVEPLKYREVFVEIRPVADENRVVTAIEILSPANKTPGHPTRASYLRKQEELLNSGVSLLEIDLLRAGEHTVAAPKEWLQLQTAAWHYLTSLHRAGQSGRFEVWPRTVRQRLPRIPVPLDADVPPVTLDLQGVFDRNYDDAAYARRIHYTRPPDPPLSTEDAAWADALLHEKGRW